MVQPLDRATRIVNQDGTPTEYFMRLLQDRGILQTDVEQAIEQINATEVIAGAGLVGGGAIGAGNITLNADAQEILDQITGTQGSVLFRGAAAWQALTPGTSGFFLKTNGAGADPAWAAGGAGGSLRGALVTKAADQIGADYTATLAVGWDSEIYDTDSIHDNVTNNSRLTVPSGVSYVRIGGGIRVQNITSGVFLNTFINKNGSSTWGGSPQSIIDIDGTSVGTTCWTAFVPVSPGDYFEYMLGVQTDTSVNVIALRSWFAMEIFQ